MASSHGAFPFTLGFHLVEMQLLAEAALTSAGYKKESDFLDDLILEYKKSEVVKKYVAEK